MPKLCEVYGYDASDVSEAASAAREKAHCPFTESTCDGGGNRHQTKIRLSNSPLRKYFAQGLDLVIPGICSIEYGGDKWIVCPRRLFGFSQEPNHTVNHSLKEHERQSLLRAGLPRGVELGIWSEVYLRYGEDDLSINYHFDFVVGKLIRNKSLADLLDEYPDHDASKEDELLRSARKGKYCSGRFHLSTPMPVLPDLRNPTIIEVMTASTSGSDTEAETDIASSFTNFILGKTHDCPGINKRQVWGRMATQLFAKSALAETWGGRTIWLVQDQLLKDIELTTKLKLNSIQDANSEAINFLSMAYRDGRTGMDSLKVAQLSTKAAGLSFDGNNKCSDILLPKVNPGKIELLNSVLRRKLSAIIVL